MFAWVPIEPAGSLTVAVRLAPSALLVLPDVETVNWGVNLRFAQFATCNGTLTGLVAPSALVIVPSIFSGVQLVGLNDACVV